MRLLLAASLSLALGCGAREPAGPTAEEVRAAIEAQNRAFGEAVRAADPAAIGALYSADGAVLPPNAPRVEGRDAVSEFWSNALASGVASAVLTTEEVSYAGGDTATEVGSALLSAEDGSALDEGKYVVVWRRADGAWRMHRDIWNSNRALPVAAAEGGETAAVESADGGDAETDAPE